MSVGRRRAGIAIAALLVAAAASAERLVGYAGGAALNTSLEEPDTTVPVPDCDGDDEATCVTAIEAADLVASSVTQCSALVASGDVIGTFPAAATVVDTGSTVVIRVSNGMACPPSNGRRIGIGLGMGIGIN